MNSSSSCCCRQVCSFVLVLFCRFLRCAHEAKKPVTRGSLGSDPSGCSRTILYIGYPGLEKTSGDRNNHSLNVVLELLLKDYLFVAGIVNSVEEIALCA